ncbi:dihydroorotase family protein [Kribbella sp. VKM Ac-2568]|uniref:dihydroorotase n=1 Tax=Kribbella sp. VKM Ac-2568 TaxID=2512219 RepID=UPI00104B9EEA|nr:dihydroorotase family protein [Kribbella sp. VKM Ac-2568]TCM42486.1 dihydroorotase [Kribbella sp. VKM Ac-2568]
MTRTDAGPEKAPVADLVVRSTRVHTGRQEIRAQIAIKDGRILAVHDLGEQVVANRELDLGDQLVIPGLVDTHCHFRDPGFTYKEDIASATRAAASGGVTTVFDMPNTEPPITTPDRLREHLDHLDRNSVVDYGHNASAVNPSLIGELAAAGAAAFKLWMSYDVERTYPHSPATAVTDRAVLYQAFEQVAATGLPLYVHPTDHELYNLMSSRAKASWGVAPASYARSFRLGDSVAFNAAVATLLEFQRSVGTRLHVLHLSSVEGIRMVREAKVAGRSVTGEANPFAMFVTNDWERIEKRGPFVLGQWVPPADNLAMWEAIVDGTVDVIGSDHAPHTEEEKLPGWQDMFAAPSGSPMIADYLRLMLTAVYDGRLTLDRAIELCCVNPARLVGLAGRKGTIEVGADADLVVVDVDHIAPIDGSTSLYKCGWSPADGLVTRGKVQRTFLRGVEIYREGQVLVDDGFGQPVIG